MNAQTILELKDVLFPNESVPRTEALCSGEQWNWQWLDSPSQCEQVADVLQGLCSPNSGTVLFKGRDPSLSRNRVGRIFCGTSFVGNLTIAENIRLPVLFENNPEAGKLMEMRIAEILQACGLNELSTQRPDRLSDPERCFWQWVRALSRPRDLFLFEGDTHIFLSDKYLRIMETFLDRECEKGAAVVSLSYRERRRS